VARELCRLCGDPDRSICALGLCSRCYQRVRRVVKREQEILAEAQAICEEIAERYAVELTMDEVGNPLGMTPLDWVLASVDTAMQKRMGGLPEDDLFL